MKNNQYKISFILPIYNVDKYLSEAVESILRQQIEKEIILVNDGSTDRSLAIALDYAQQYPFISVISSSANFGVSAARNKGFSIARGEYVLFLDPDDTLDNNLDLSVVYQLAKQFNAQVVKGQFTQYYEYDPNKIYLRNPTLEGVNEQCIADISLNGFLRNALTRGWFIQIASFLISREFIKENRLSYREDIAIGEDGLFNVDLLSCEGLVLEVPMIFMNYRMRKNSAMDSVISEKRLDSANKTIHYIRQKIESCKDEALKQSLNVALAINHYYLHRDYLLSDDEILKEKFKSIITQEFIDFYKSSGIEVNDLVIEDKSS